MKKDDTYWGNDPYFEYLCDIIKGEYYHKLLWELDQMDFHSPVELDSNCLSYAQDLRRGYNNRYSCGRDGPVSVFEVMVALAVRCEQDVMCEMARGDRTPDWFHQMIDNLGFSRWTDDNFGSAEKVGCSIAIDNWLNRNISQTGEGSAFPLCVSDRRRDCRKASLWMEMMWFMAENYDSGIEEFS